MPAFGPVKIREMFSSMTDIASQLLAKWEVRNMPFRRLSYSSILSCDTEVLSCGIFMNCCTAHSQLRFGPDYVIDATEDFTRLAFDTVAL